MGGVVLQQIRQVIGWNQVIDADKFNVGVFDACPKNQASNATKSVNANFKCHG
jgi:hypothetical protein